MKKLELIRKLESLIAFQTACLAEGNWEDFDHAESIVKGLEKEIIAEQV